MEQMEDPTYFSLNVAFFLESIASFNQTHLDCFENSNLTYATFDLQFYDIIACIPLKVLLSC